MRAANLACRAWLVVACAGGGADLKAAEPAAGFDLLLRGGLVIDESWRAAQRADVGIREGRVAAIGDLANAAAKRVVDVEGLIVAPGFVDLHSHAETGLTSDDPARRAAPNLVTQGITTVVVNQDGYGPPSIAAQRDKMQSLGVGLNVVQLVGHGQVRRAVLGDDHRRTASPVELERMRALLRAGMREGAWGLSAGLEYVPGRWSDAAEMLALVAELAPCRAVYVVHERASGTAPLWYLPSQQAQAPQSMLDNLQEQIDIAERTGVTVVATHIKARGTDFWGSSRVMIDMLSRARARGVPIWADHYAYNTSGTDGRITLVPPWLAETLGNDTPRGGRDDAGLLEFALKDQDLATKVRADIEYEIMRRGGPEGILVVEHPKQDYVGRSLAELAATEAIAPVEMAIRLQTRDRARLRAFSMSEVDVEAFAAVPWIATSSDAGIALPKDDPVHPRFYGAFPRKLRHYAIDRGLLTLEEAVRVSSGLPASILGLKDRGTLTPGAWADIVVFDRERIRDRADPFKPHQYCEGVVYVLVNGCIAVEQEKCSGALAGTVIAGPGVPK